MNTIFRSFRIVDTGYRYCVEQKYPWQKGYEWRCIYCYHCLWAAKIMLWVLRTLESRKYRAYLKREAGKRPCRVLDL